VRGRVRRDAGAIMMQVVAIFGTSEVPWKSSMTGMSVC
jgi:hypothetical protein